MTHQIYVYLTTKSTVITLYDSIIPIMYTLYGSFSLILPLLQRNRYNLHIIIATKIKGEISLRVASK